MASGPNKSECWEVLGAFSQNLRNSQNSQHVEQDQFRSPLWPPVSQLQYVSLPLATHQIVTNSALELYIQKLSNLHLSFAYSWVSHWVSQTLKFHILTPEFRILSNNYLTLHLSFAYSWVSSWVSQTLEFHILLSSVYSRTNTWRLETDSTLLTGCPVYMYRICIALDMICTSKPDAFKYNVTFQPVSSMSMQHLNQNIQLKYIKPSDSYWSAVSYAKFGSDNVGALTLTTSHQH